MNCKRFVISSSCLLAIIAFASGCGNPSGDQPELAPVTGTVTMNGQPLAGASVRFYPSEGRPSAGVTNDQGEYELVYLQGNKGAIIGSHTVRISTQDEENDPMGEQNTETVPARYNRETTLSATVENKSNAIDFTLTSK